MSDPQIRSIAHDINNLLTVISGHAGMLLSEKPDNPDTAQSLQIIADASKRASQLTTELLGITPKLNAASPPAEASSRLVSRDAENSLDGRGQTVLVLENDLPLLKLTRHILERYGYKVLEAFTQKEASESWNANQNQIDLFLTDLRLADGSSGVELAKTFLAQKSGLKILYASASKPDALPKDLLQTGACGFLQKPFHARSLAQAAFDTLATN